MWGEKVPFFGSFLQLMLPKLCTTSVQGEPSTVYCICGLFTSRNVGWVQSNENQGCHQRRTILEGKNCFSGKLWHDRILTRSEGPLEPNPILTLMPHYLWSSTNHDRWNELTGRVLMTSKDQSNNGNTTGTWRKLDLDGTEWLTWRSQERKEGHH